MIKSGNPALATNTFTSIGYTQRGEAMMTLQGTVNKTIIMLALLVFSASFTWGMFLNNPTNPLINVLMIGGVVAGLLCAVVLAFKKNLAPVLGPLYAIFQGLAVGGISSFFELRFPGIVLQAVMATVCVFAALLFAYKSRMIQATENFKLGVTAATGGIMLIYLVSFVLSLFGTSIPLIHESGIIGIGFSLVVVVIAALNLVMDFDFIEEGANSGAPKYMEWYGAFGLTVTLVWLYLEMLRLLSKLQSRD